MAKDDFDYGSLPVINDGGQGASDNFDYASLPIVGGDAEAGGGVDYAALPIVGGEEAPSTDEGQAPTEADEPAVFGDAVSEGLRGAGRAAKAFGGGVLSTATSALRLAGTVPRIFGWDGIHRLADSIDQGYANFGADTLASDYGLDEGVNIGTIGEKMAGVSGSLAGLGAAGKAATAAGGAIKAAGAAKTGTAVAKNLLPAMFGNDAAVQAYDTARANDRSKGEAAALAAVNGAIHFFGFKMFDNAWLSKVAKTGPEVQAQMGRIAADAVKTGAPKSYTELVGQIRRGIVNYHTAQKIRGAAKAGTIMGVQDALSDVPMQIAEGTSWDDLDLSRIAEKGLHGLGEGAFMEGSLALAGMLRSGHSARKFVADKFYRGRDYYVEGPDGRPRKEPGLLDTEQGRFFIMKQSPDATARVLDIVEHGGKPTKAELDAAFLPPDMTSDEIKKFGRDWARDLSVEETRGEEAEAFGDGEELTGSEDVRAQNEMAARGVAAEEEAEMGARIERQGEAMRQNAAVREQADYDRMMEAREDARARVALEAERQQRERVAREKAAEDEQARALAKAQAREQAERIRAEKRRVKQEEDEARRQAQDEARQAEFEQEQAIRDFADEQNSIPAHAALEEIRDSKLRRDTDGTGGDVRRDYPEYYRWLSETGKKDNAKNWNRFVAENDLAPQLRLTTPDEQKRKDEQDFEQGLAPDDELAAFREYQAYQRSDDYRSGRSNLTFDEWKRRRDMPQPEPPPPEVVDRPNRLRRQQPNNFRHPGDNRLRPAVPDINQQPIRETNDETGNGADEAPAQPVAQVFGRDGRQPPPEAGARPLEGAAARAEAPDAGVVAPQASVSERAASAVRADGAEPQTAEKLRDAMKGDNVLKKIDAAYKKAKTDAERNALKERFAARVEELREKWQKPRSGDNPPVAENEETTPAAKEEAAERPAEYLAWLEKYKMKDTDKHFAEWQRKQAAQKPTKTAPASASYSERLDAGDRITLVRDKDGDKMHIDHRTYPGLKKLVPEQSYVIHYEQANDGTMRVGVPSRRVDGADAIVAEIEGLKKLGWKEARQTSKTAPASAGENNTSSRSETQRTIDEIDRQKRESAQRVKLSDEAVSDIQKWIADNPDGNFADSGLRGVFDAEMERVKARNGGKVDPKDVMPTLDAISVAYEDMKNAPASAQERIAKSYADYVEEPVPEWAKRLSAKDAEEYARLLEDAQRRGGDEDGGDALDALEAFERAHDNRLRPAKDARGTRGKGAASARSAEGMATPPKSADAPQGGKLASGAIPASPTPEMRRKAIAAMRILGADAGKDAAALEAELRRMEERGQATSGPGRRKAEALRDLAAYRRAVGTKEVSAEEIAEGRQRDAEQRIIEGKGDTLPSEDFYGRRQSRGKGDMPAKWTDAAKKPLERVAHALRNVVTIGGKRLKVSFVDRPAGADGQTRYMRNGDGEVVGEYDADKGEIRLYPGATVADVVHEFTHPLVDFARAEANAGRGELLGKIKEIVDAERATWEEPVRDAYADKGEGEILEEIFTHAMGDKGATLFGKSTTTLEGRRWYNRLWDAIKGVWQDFATKMGWNKADLRGLDKMSPEAAAQKILSEMAQGRNFGDAMTGGEGARNAFAGHNGAERLGIGKRGDAEQMEKSGADREDIWRTTGWWRGRDGKWRVEIPDVKRKRWDGDPEERHFMGGGEDFYRYRLTELIEDGDFLKAYPKARDIVVEFHKNMPANVGGNFNDATLTIKMPQKFHLTTDWAKEGLGDGKSAELNEAGRKTIVHELQHAIQRFEGFAKGGSQTEPVRPYALDGETGHALSVFGEAVGLDPTNDGHLLNIANWAQKITSDYTKGDVPQRIVESFEAAAKEAGKTPQEFRDEIERLYDSHTETPLGQYIRLEGEVEARNVRERLGMTPEARAAIPPWKTEDVPEDRQIVRMDGGGTRESRRVTPRNVPPAPTNQDIQDYLGGKDDFMRRLRRAFQDKNIVIRDVEERLGVTGKDASVYYAKDRAFGKNEHELTVLEKREVEPIVEKIHKSGGSLDLFSAYLYARHSGERNAALKASKGVENGSGMTKEQADTIFKAVDRLGLRAAFEDAARDVWAMNRKYLQRRVDSGRMTQADYDFYTQRYKHYVPLRTDMTDEELDIFNSTTGGWKRNELMAAQGRKSAADDPLAFSIVQNEQAIRASNANEVRRRFAGLVRRSKGALGEVVDGVNKGGAKWSFTFGDGETVETGSPMRLASERDDIVLFKENGQLKAVKVNPGEHGRGLDLARAVTDKDVAQFNKHLEWIPRATRWMSAMRTQYVPTFIVRNMKADNLEIMLNALSERGVKDGTKFFGRFLKNEVSVAKGVKEYFKTGKSSDRFVQEAVENGLLTSGGMSAEGFTETARRLSDTLRALRERPKILGGAFEAAKDTISLLNACAEYNTRMGVYKTLREEGMSVADAVSYARDVTVNFNRKGYLTPYTNAAFMFSNAAVQGMGRAFKSMNSAHGKEVLAGMFLVGVAQALLDDWLGHDDESEKSGGADSRNLTEYDKSHSLGVALPTGHRVKTGIRNPWALPMYAGRKAVELLKGITSGEQAMKDLASEVGQFVTEPVGGNGFDSTSEFLQTLAPTIIDPFVQWGTGKDYRGQDRLKKSFDKYAPDSWNGKDSTPEAYKAVAKALNFISGGSEHRKGAFDVAPENVRLLTETVFGGVLTDLNNLVKGGEHAVDAVRGKPAAQIARDIPFVRDTFTNMPDNTSRFYAALDAYNADKAEFKKTTELGRRRDMKREKPYLTQGKGRVDTLIERVKELRHLERGEVKAGQKWVAPHVPRTEAQMERHRKERLRLQAEVLRILKK